TRAKHIYQSFATDFDYRIVIISNQSNQETIRQLLAEERNLIVIIASSMKLPIEAGELARYQWVDYRRQTKGLLRDLAEDLWEPGFDDVTRARSLLIVPESVDKTVLPDSVRYGTGLLRLLAAGQFSGAVTGLLLPLFKSSTTNTIQPVSPIIA